MSSVHISFEVGNRWDCGKNSLLQKRLNIESEIQQIHLRLMIFSVRAKLGQLAYSLTNYL